MNIKKAKPVTKAKSTEAFDVDAFMSEVNSEYGVGTIFRASDASPLRYLRTGCAKVDIALGGGFPMGRMIEVYGSESAGKSTLLYKLMARFQREFPAGLAVLIDLERTFEKTYAQLLGLDTDRLVVISPDNGEQASDLLDRALLQNADMLVGIDSIAAMTPISTMDGSAEDQQMGVHARLINRTMARCNARMKRNLADESYPMTTAVFINQMREKIGVMFGDPRTTPGGKGKNFFTSLRLELFSSQAKAMKIEESREINGVKKDILVGRIVKFTVVKNKSGGTPFEDGEYRFYIKPFNGYEAWSFDNEDALFEAGRFYGLITVSKSTGAFVYGSISEKKATSFVEELQGDPELCENLYAEVLEAVRNYNSTGANAEPPKKTVSVKIKSTIEEL